MAKKDIIEAAKTAIIESRESLIEMYKAGFLDGYSIHNKVKTKKDFMLMNKQYKLKFDARFGKAITKGMKKKVKK